jgi:lipopolysaccharide/colanic/teichoic acid biosynthesis glycosyltransferase
LAPIFLLVAAAIKLDSSGPIFFVQWRSGLGGRLFSMFKFRSMVVDAEQRKKDMGELNEQDGPAFKMEQDPRLTAVGRFLRKTSLDETPQLWNVLRGEMSLVGPRPLPVDETAACQDWQRRRLDVTPGLTCIWQVKDRRTKIPFADWMRMDIRYTRSRSLINDLKLIFRTILLILRGRGM